MTDDILAMREFFRKRRTDPAIEKERQLLLAQRKEEQELYDRLQRAHLPDPNAPDTLGWRLWVWDEEKQMLRSPQQNAYWHTSELRVLDWDTAEALRSKKGIHAARMPLWWERADYHKNAELKSVSPIRFSKIVRIKKRVIRIPAMPFIVVDGIVERMRRFVLGTKGWRSEWAIIKRLRAPNAEIGLKLEKLYSDTAEIYYEDRTS